MRIKCKAMIYFFLTDALHFFTPDEEPSPGTGRIPSRRVCCVLYGLYQLQFIAEKRRREEDCSITLQ